MGKKCTIKDKLFCSDENEEDEDAQCPSLSLLSAANPNATFTCLGKNGKKESVQCTIDGKTNTAQGKGKKLVKWATSAACTADDDNNGEPRSASEHSMVLLMVCQS